jgi:hypothetical protein
MGGDAMTTITRRVLIMPGLVVTTLLTIPSASAQEPAVRAAPRIVGTWKLNAEKSNVPVQPGRLEIRQYTQRPDGFLVGLLIYGNSQGPFHYLQFAARSDGKDYPEYSDEIVADMVAAGRPTPRTYSETISDESLSSWTDKVNGRITAHGKKTVSKDGGTLTITVDETSRVYVYDRLNSSTPIRP